jgi:hypothetical protein
VVEGKEMLSPKTEKEKELLKRVCRTTPSSVRQKQPLQNPFFFFSEIIKRKIPCMIML